MHILKPMMSDSLLKFRIFSALKIHITGECKAALEDLGGYMIERRGIIEVKVQLSGKNVVTLRLGY